MIPSSRELAVVVHELRSPVAALVALAEAGRRHGGEGSQPRELARLAIAACHGIVRIVGDASASSVRREPVDVGALVADVVIASRLRGRQVVAEVDPDLPLVEGDRERLGQVLDAVLENAFVHSSAEGGVLVRVARGGAGVRVAVVDSGAGVPVEERDRIFDRGVRLDAGRPGSGLGLFVARAIAEAHSGSLVVEATEGPGATFVLELPV